MTYVSVLMYLNSPQFRPPAAVASAAAAIIIVIMHKHVVLNYEIPEDSTFVFVPFNLLSEKLALYACMCVCVGTDAY